MQYIQYLIIGIVLIIVLLAILKANKKDANLDFNKLVEALGGKENIVRCGASLLRICIHLKDLEQVNIEEIQDLHIKRVSETNYGIDIECGTSAYIICNKINKLIKL